MELETIAKRLVKARGRQTQEQVAKSVGISTSALAMYETANRMPRDEVKKRLADYYGMTVQEIFFD